MIEVLRQRINAMNDTWLKAYEHFRLRLNERYGIDISFKEYILLCNGSIEKIGNISNNKKRIGWVKISGTDVLVVKEIKRDKRISTALYPDMKKISKKIQNNDTPIPNYPKNP